MTDPGDITGYLALITSEHNTKPDFMAAVAALVQGPADGAAVMQAMPDGYDLDAAVGVQLDAVGLWVGVTRDVETPITGVFFSFDTVNQGFDQGIWKGPFDADEGVTVLSDPFYRLLIKAKIAANEWDGTIPGAYAAYAILFPPPNYVHIVDNENMTMTVILGGPTPSALVQALFTGGYLSLRPAGVGSTNTVLNGPIFGFDQNNDVIAGFDVGTWI